MRTDPAPRSRRRALRTALVAALVAMTALTALVVAPERPDSTPRAQTDQGAAHGEPPPPSGPLTFVVDGSLEPVLAEVAPVDGTDIARPVGAYAAAGAQPASLVLDEVVLHATEASELDAFLIRWDGTLLDSFEPEADGSQDHLVRVDASRADPDDLVEDLLAYEPEHAGEHRVSDERVLNLLALAAAEWRSGHEVVIDWLLEPASIESGEVTEADRGNVFQWPYVVDGADMDAGVGVAWQLLADNDLLHPTRSLMVADGGFVPNADFPRDNQIRKGSWGSENPMECGGNPCPWHGTNVAMTAIARVDNQYGTAGSGGPVADAFLAYYADWDWWTIMRRIERYAEDYRPDVVNLSIGRNVDVGKGHASKWTDRRMDHVADTGALVVASAGNEGRNVDGSTLVIPCESQHVLCVGGMTSSARRDPSSNYGTVDRSTSVEIYGPYCVRGLASPPDAAQDDSTARTCGTSFASPWVAGIGLLVKAADPSLSGREIRQILVETASAGDLGAEVTGSERRVDAVAAVARALGVTPPQLTIRSPRPDQEVPVGRWVDFLADATDYRGAEIDVEWTSSIDGPIGTGDSGRDTLSAGNHVITATATDRAGNAVSATVTLRVVDHPPDVRVIHPTPDFKLWAGGEVPLVGRTLDPDGWASLADDDVEWRVERNGVEVFTAHGHHVDLPGHVTEAGTYQVTFSGGGVSASSSFTVLDPPPGMTPPTAHIVAPGDVTLGTDGNHPAQLTLSGYGQDTEDGVLDATRLRWTARSGDTVVILCQGSQVPGSGGGGLVLPKACDSVDAQLEIAPGDVQFSEWVVQLEVWDSTGLKSNPASINVTVEVHVP